MPTPGIELASVSDALAALDHATGMVCAGEIAQIMAIAALCDLHRVDESKLVEGCERWVPGGADGTPTIGEFIAAEIGAMLGVSPASAMTRIARVLNVRHRHPVLWAAVVAGGMRFYEAARVADACAVAGLSAEACRWLDQQCAIALRLQPWARVRGKIDAWIPMADPALAAERAAKAAEARNVGVGRIVDGHCDLWGRVDAADGIAFDQALNTIAATLTDGQPAGQPGDAAPCGDVVRAHMSRDHRRAAAVGVLARQALGQAELPRAAEIIVRIDATTAPAAVDAPADLAVVDATADAVGALACGDVVAGEITMFPDGRPHPAGAGAFARGDKVAEGATLTDGDRSHLGIAAEGGAASRRALPGAATACPGGSVRGETSFVAGLVLSPVAEVQGWGAVLTSQLGSLLDGCKVTVRPVVDTRRLPEARGYEIPDSMRLAVTERWPVDAFPYGTTRSNACDVDHSKPYGDGGLTEVDNLAPLERFGHRVRTHGGWKLEQSEPGRLTWRSPHGYTYAVTPAGTLRIGRPPPSEHDWWNQEPPDWLDPA